MRFRLEYWIDEIKQKWVSEHPEAATPKDWVILCDGDIWNQFDDRTEALAGLLECMVEEAYGEFENQLCEKLGLEAELVQEILLGHLLSPQEQEAIIKLAEDRDAPQPK